MKKIFALMLFVIACTPHIKSFEIKEPPSVQEDVNPNTTTSFTCCAKYAGISCHVREGNIGERCFCTNYNTYYMPYSGSYCSE